MGLIIGTVDGPIAEKDVRTVDKSTIVKKLATKIMMVHVVSLDGKVALPLIHYATTGVEGKWMAEKVITSYIVLANAYVDNKLV
jgi:hypothetical protein